MSPSALALALGAAGALGAAWVAYFRWKDKALPEPRALVAGAVLAGAASVAPALAAFAGLDALGVGPTWEGLALEPLPRAALSALGLGLAEELAKLLPVAFLALASRHFDEPLDGPVYAAHCAIGFAVAEGAALALAAAEPTPVLLARALVAPATHALFAAPGGLGIARFVLSRRRAALPLGLFASAALHGAYDLLLARDAAPAAAALVLALWVWLIPTLRRLAAEGRVVRDAGASAASR